MSKNRIEYDDPKLGSTPGAEQLPAPPPPEPEPFPRMVYKSQEVDLPEPVPLQRTVSTQEELDAAAADGWHEDPAKAQKAAKKK